MNFEGTGLRWWSILSATDDAWCMDGCAVLNQHTAQKFIQAKLEETHALLGTSPSDLRVVIGGIVGRSRVATPS